MKILDMTDPQIVALATLLGAQIRRDENGFWRVQNFPDGGHFGARNYIARAAMDFLVVHGCLTDKQAQPFYERTWNTLPYNVHQKHEWFLQQAEKEYNDGECLP